jgi:haloacetate dehalogenase
MRFVHDRGGRTGHRMALDHPDILSSLAVMDIVPTHAMFSKASSKIAVLLGFLASNPL